MGRRSVPVDAGDLDLAELRAGQIRWATIDSPWLHDVDRAAFGHSLDQMRSLEPSMICSSHLPPAPGAMLDVLLESLASTLEADRFEGPDQPVLEAMLGAVPSA